MPIIKKAGLGYKMGTPPHKVTHVVAKPKIHLRNCHKINYEPIPKIP